MSFSLSKYFNSFDVNNEYKISNSILDNTLNDVTIKLANDVSCILHDNQVFEDLVELVHGFKNLEDKLQKQIVYLIKSSLVIASEKAQECIDLKESVKSFNEIKSLLEIYGYLIYVLIKYLSFEDCFKKILLGNKDPELVAKSKKKWDANVENIEDCLYCVTIVLKINLILVFKKHSERDLFVQLFSRSLISLMENQKRMKISSIRDFISSIILYCIIFHDHLEIIQDLIVQCLTYHVHLSHYMAELLYVLVTKHNHTVLLDEIIRILSGSTFNPNDTNGPKSVSDFFIRLSELCAKQMSKQMSFISGLFDNPNVVLRCSVVEVCCNIIINLLQETNSEDLNAINNNQQIDNLLNLLHQRFLDNNPYVRSKTFQAFKKIFSLNTNLNSQKKKITPLALRSLTDKSVLVRRNVIKLLHLLILTNQFQNVHGLDLSYDLWNNKLIESKKKKNFILQSDSYKKKRMKYDYPQVNTSFEIETSDIYDSKLKDTGSFDNSFLSNNLQVLNESESDFLLEDKENNINIINKLIKAKLKVEYYNDALEFITAIEKSVCIISQLVFSKNKNETLDSMDFLVIANKYKIRYSDKGINFMLHLVWQNDNSDEGKSIISHLINCYKSLFLTMPKDIFGAEKNIYIANNLIRLTYNASNSDLTSLERLLCLIYKQNFINNDVLNVLWSIYSMKINENDPDEDQLSLKKKRYGAIIVLGCFGVEDSQILVNNLGKILKYCFNNDWKKDLLLCQHSCNSLQKISMNVHNSLIIKNTEEIENLVKKLKDVTICFFENPDWYNLASLTINVISKFSKNINDDFSLIIREKSKLVFNPEVSHYKNMVSLSQLLFIVGNISIKIIVHLDKMEFDFKKKKQELEFKDKLKPSNKKIGVSKDNEFEIIDRTSEEDFINALLNAKEQRLLYSENSIIKRFGFIAKEICSNNNIYTFKLLQRSAVLCMAKLMCISSIYCEENLSLLITIMQNSDDPVTRCNCIIAFSDLIVLFNSIMEESTYYLFLQLTDKNLLVQRTCFITVTFLILSGQLKFKGQLSSMATFLESSDKCISNLCQLFFSELATKDNAIYNNFIEIYNGLSSDVTISKESFNKIIKFLLSFITKEKYQKSLNEKFLDRLVKCKTESQWNSLSFVLNSISYKDDFTINILNEGFKFIN